MRLILDGMENAMPVDDNDEFKLSKREIKRRLKGKKTMNKDLAQKIM